MIDNIQAVIFDLDGSLVDSMWVWPQIDIEYLARFGHKPPEGGLQGAIDGMSFSETAVWFKEHFSIPDSVEQIKDDWNKMAWNKYENEVTLKPGAHEFLDYCKEKGILLGIATSNSRQLAESVVRAQGLEGYFCCIMTSCDVGKGKPAPDIYLAAASKMEVTPENCLVFEDIIQGIQAGKAAGMKVCAVEDKASIYQTYEKQQLADFYIKDFREILK